MSHRLATCFLGGVLAAPSTLAQESDAFEDALLDHLVGMWTMTSHVMDDSVRYDATAEWVLGHQFLRLQMTDVNQPPQYATHVYIGYDSTGQRYVAHWLDISGGGASTTLGHGRRQNDTLIFRFDDSDGPYRTAFEHRPDGTGRVRMRSKSESGEWRPFAAYTMRPTRP